MMYSGPHIPLNYKDAAIVPFHVEHLGRLVDLMKSWEWALPDEWRPHAYERLMTLAASPDSRFYSVIGIGDQWQGCVYLTQVVPHRTAWSHGYCRLSEHVFGAVAALRVMNSLAFKELDLDVIYTEHCSENRAVTAVALKAGYKKAGLMPKSKVFNEKIYDSVILALTREQWAESERS